MDLLSVDRRKCDQEGICVAACPLRLIKMEEDGYPVPVSGADEVCIRCGHCVAVCPGGALSHRDFDLNQFEPVRDSLTISPDQCQQFIANRRSVRAFREKPVSKDKLARLIETSRRAPTGRNAQDVNWMVICDRGEIFKMSSMVIEYYCSMMKNSSPEANLNPHLGKLIREWESGIDVILHNTPALIITHAQKGNHLGFINCIIALSNLELAATGMGLGCCWAGFFMAASAGYEPMKEALSLPEGHECCGAMMTGYPRFRYQRIPPRRPPVITWKM